ncbi:putative Separin [Leptomonas pyrrhocoris]|uniref:separase n=1 Tax=Leptomonas pyrrhocoris TaxID=157538 RepID=A0A0M9FSI8_LEPPY|nr:putative Separin [Leptomonas pyrrhocoris]KPA75200.1 putative Separin [Leptomonas pyrrhocoris]|eukprot:XP_015653639.1 putative Separin [Leptomonas pyrrhocoris]
MSQRDVERVATELDSLRDFSGANSFSCCSLSTFSVTKGNADVYRTALSVLMALLAYFHVIAADDDADAGERDGEDGSFQSASETVWCCVHGWASSDANAGVRVMALTTWMNTVLRRALRSGTAAPLLRTVDWLEGFLTSATPSLTPPATAANFPASATLDECWARLHTRVLQHVCMSLHKSQALLKERWSHVVAVVLARVFAHEPPLLSGTFSQAFHLGDSFENSLSGLVDEVRCLHGDASAEAFSLEAGARVFSPLLQLAALQRHADAMCLRITPFMSAQTYATYVRPGVAVCLRWGLVDVAMTLLEWAFDGLDDHGEAWLQRLRQLNCEADLAVEKRAAVLLIRTDEAQHEVKTRDSFGGYLYSEWMEQQSSSSPEWPVTASQALTILVGSNSTCVNQLRLVCDALLRCPAAWSTQVLTDPYAAYFVLRSLAQLATHFLDIGDPPLARFYLALLCRLLPRYLCPSLLRVVLSLFQRFARALSSYCLTPVEHAVPSSAYEQSVLAWRRVREHLDAAALPNFNAEKLPSTNLTGLSTYVTGAAWRARREFQLHCAATHSPPLLRETDSPATTQADSRFDLRGTVVEAQFNPDHGGTLRLQWCQLGTHARRSSHLGFEACGFAPCHTTGHRGVADELRACAAAMADVLRHNREQLLRGSGGAEAAGENAPWVESRGRTQDSSFSLSTEGTENAKTTSSRSDTPPAATAAAYSFVAEAAAQVRHQRKTEWWQARYALDARIHTAVLSLQKILGGLRVLLAGRPGDELTSRLATLAMNFASQCVQLRGSQSCPSLDALYRATLFVLLGGPFLWSTARDDNDAQPSCFYGPPEHHMCSACAATLRKARTSLLEAIIETGQSMVTYDERQPAPLIPDCSEAGDDDDDAWVSLLVDTSLNALVEALASAALSAYYDECVLHTVDSAETSPRHHLDLLLHPREHTYLILGGELHGLPWEGLDVCRDRSTSRVPSLDYLRCAYQSLRGDAVSLRRTLLYRDCEAYLSNSGLTDLIARRPTWEVNYGDTLCSAAAAQRTRGQPSSSASTLLRRVVGPPTDTDHLDTYVYAGHRGGEQLISRDALYEWLPCSLCTQSSLVLLMGCSSARMLGNAEYDNFGLPYAYLSAGCSCVVGCLWDVTDGDVDRLTCRLLNFAATAPSTRTTVGESLAVARRACKLRCLTGLSTVFYGLNLPFEKV